MALYLNIVKVSESPTHATYKFFVVTEDIGMLEIEKNSGKIQLIKSINTKNGTDHFHRASHKLKKHRSLGKYPDKTSWVT